jgi:hypothetical protein
MSEETSVIVAESAHDSSSEASRSKTVILSNSAGISNTPEIRGNDKRAEDEAVAIHDHQYHSTLQEEDKSEDAAVPEP